MNQSLIVKIIMNDNIRHPAVAYLQWYSETQTGSHYNTALTLARHFLHIVPSFILYLANSSCHTVGLAKATSFILMVFILFFK